MSRVTALCGWTGCRVVVVVVLRIELDLRGCHSERTAEGGIRFGVNKTYGGGTRFRKETLRP